MAPPEDLKVDLNALRSDAAMWDDAADRITGPIQTIAQLHLAGGPDFSGLGERMGLHVSYGHVRNRMEQFMADAADYFESLADTLRKVANYHEELETGNAERFGQIERGMAD